MRFGIGMNTDHTLEEVGQQFSVTRERIRQIEAKALRKLKHPSRSRKLRASWIRNARGRSRHFQIVIPAKAGTTHGACWRRPYTEDSNSWMVGLRRRYEVGRRRAVRARGSWLERRS